MEFQYLISKSEKMMEGDGFMVALWSFLNLGALIYLIYLLVPELFILPETLT